MQKQKNGEIQSNIDVKLLQSSRKVGDSIEINETYRLIMSERDTCKIKEQDQMLLPIEYRQKPIVNYQMPMPSNHNQRNIKRISHTSQVPMRFNKLKPSQKDSNKASYTIMLPDNPIPIEQDINSLESKRHHYSFSQNAIDKGKRKKSPIRKITSKVPSIIKTQSLKVDNAV